MAYKCLLLSTKYQLDYVEIDIDNRSIPIGYDFYFFNYHLVTMDWLQTKSLKKELGFVATMVLEVLPDNPFVMCSDKDFDAYCVLDPTVKSKNKKVYPFPRPLEKIDIDLRIVDNPVPVIGTFGFATKGKGFQHVVDAVNKEFSKAIVRINIPYGDFVPNSKEYAAFLADVCKSKAKDGIEVRVTHDFMQKEELIAWCSSNTLNCFLYDRDMQGLAATTDQAIVSGRPLSVSDNNTFRHITSYLSPYPKFSLQDSINKSTQIVEKMKEDWSPENFAKKFERVLEDNALVLKSRKKISGIFLLPIKKETFINTIERKIEKYKHRINSLGWETLLKKRNSRKVEDII
ncbi:hypothetical protein ACQ33O_11600 [Ferruginibacter sp. SUN002]|uniref:hypothetical protein n=1 Tax=Ferruginibacter sp. SUN002 TaxID=2937789 RepID=UPI003D36BD5E